MTRKTFFSTILAGLLGFVASLVGAGKPAKIESCDQCPNWTPRPAQFYREKPGNNGRPLIVGTCSVTRDPKDRLYRGQGHTWSDDLCLEMSGAKDASV